MAWQLSYYSPRVAEQVERWPVDVRASYGRIAEAMMEHGPDLGLPRTRAMGAGLFEVRAKGREGIGRAFFCTLIGKRIVILHAFVKKSEKTPDRELKLARKRLKEVKA
ncbi:MAG: type II toxin-antitoxin system RelE/ParE family toxin [Gammaproteobacteria bacterium]